MWDGLSMSDTKYWFTWAVLMSLLGALWGAIAFEIDMSLSKILLSIAIHALLISSIMWITFLYCLFEALIKKLFGKNES